MERLECVVCNQRFLIELDPKLTEQVEPEDMVQIECPKCEGKWAQLAGAKKEQRAARPAAKPAPKRRAPRQRIPGRITSTAILRMKKAQLFKLIQKNGGEVSKEMGTVQLRQTANEMRREGKLKA